ncbi:MAG: hypothetical protein NTX72_03930 [Candidatus Uhrbacteria bacterium]|nr:hypothetical protein [Candidatus Uhrbacteria bacterium]
MTLVITWATFKWAIIPIVIFLLIGLSGVMPDNDFGPIRAGIAVISGIAFLAWIAIFVVRGFLL